MGRKPLGKVVREPRTLTDGRVKLRLLGTYYFSDEASFTLMEFLVEGPDYLLSDLETFRLYTMPDWDQAPEPIRPQFILDPTGERLLGSYLHPLLVEEPPSTPAGYRRRVTFRFASFIPELFCGYIMTPLGPLIELEPEPIPERLLRLIWLDT
jgi:hypothetical protein